MVVVIGGGSAGLYFAQKYKKLHKKEKVIVIEEHTQIGKPIQCTGILTREIETLIPKKDIKTFTLNKIKETEVFSPNNSVKTKISEDYIICNVSFIKYLEKKAKKEGVIVLTGKRYINNMGNKIEIRDIKTQKIDTLIDNKLVGADGPSSLVAKNNNLYNKNRQFLTGVQARIKVKNLNQEKIDFYPYIGEYAWFTPESKNIARVGVATKKNAKQLFDEFIKKYPGKILEMQGGPIPIHQPRIKVQHSIQSAHGSIFRVCLLGDAALQIKNTTGGGIIPGLKAANILANHFEYYEKHLKKLNLELRLHYILNKILGSYNDKDWDRLLNKTKQPKIQRILRTTNRDKLLKMAILLATNPKMVFEGIRALTKLIKSSKHI